MWVLLPIHVHVQALRVVVPVLDHVLKHASRHVLKHVPVRQLLEHMPWHMLEHVPKQLPDRYVLDRHICLPSTCSGLG